MADDRFEQIKTLAIIALVSDDELMEKLVLKGGNAIRLLHPSPVRQSLDLDFSVEGDLGPLNEVQARIEGRLLATFEREGLTVFDVRLFSAPPDIEEDNVGAFWGGYTLTFKVLRKEKV